jgi:hypothetical protein
LRQVLHTFSQLLLCGAAPYLVLHQMAVAAHLEAAAAHQEAAQPETMLLL